MTELEQQLQTYAAKIEEVKNQNVLLTTKLRQQTEREIKYEVTIQVMEAFIDRLLDRIGD